MRCLTLFSLSHTRSSVPSAGAPAHSPHSPGFVAHVADNARRGPLADPVQTPTCQHLFCRACLARSLSLARSCPIDRSPLDSVHACEPAPRAVRELLDDLTVRCLRGNGACGKEMRRDEWDRHALECGMPGERAEDIKEKSAGAGQGKESAEELRTDGTERCELCDVEVLSSELPVRPPFPCTIGPDRKSVV